METRTAQLEVCWARAHDNRAKGRSRRVGFMVRVEGVDVEVDDGDVDSGVEAQLRFRGSALFRVQRCE